MVLDKFTQYFPSTGTLAFHFQELYSRIVSQRPGIKSQQMAVHTKAKMPPNGKTEMALVGKIFFYLPTTSQFCAVTPFLSG